MLAVLAVPPDVVVARTLRSLTRALVVCCGAVLALGMLGAAILALAGGSADALTPGLALVGLGQAGGLAGAAVVGLGLYRVATDPAARPAAASPGATRRTGAEASEADAVRAAGARETVGRRLGLVARLLLAACVVVATAWTLAETAAALGVLVGALVSTQLAVVLLVVARRLATAAEPPPASR